MPLELNPSAQAVQSLPEPAPYDAVADRDSVVAGLADSQVIDDLTSTIDISDMTTILTFGARAAEDDRRRHAGNVAGPDDCRD